MPKEHLKYGDRLQASAMCYRIPNIAQFEIRVSTQNEPDESAQAVGQVAHQAGTYVNLTKSPPMRSLDTRRSRGRGPAKNGWPDPSTMGWM